MSQTPYADPTPEEVREALRKHLARKLGWSDKTAAFCLAPLSNSDIARCLHTDPGVTRTALYARGCLVMARALVPTFGEILGQSEAA